MVSGEPWGGGLPQSILRTFQGCPPEGKRRRDGRPRGEECEESISIHDHAAMPWRRYERPYRTPMYLDTLMLVTYPVAVDPFIPSPMRFVSSSARSSSLPRFELGLDGWMDADV